MKRVSSQVFLIAAVVAGCSSATTEPLSSNPSEAVVAAERGQTFELRPGQTARVGDGGLLVGFRGVGTDSRCPTDVQCVWSGDAALNIAVTIGRMAWTSLQLHTDVEPRSATFRDYTITVVSLRPAPHSESRIRPQDYVVTLRVE
jgi:hypothetical protein